MEEVGSDAPRERGILVCGDIDPFKSVVDGTTISGRAALREHNKRNDVTFAEDFRGDWDRKRKERDSMFSGDSRFDRSRRIEAIKHAVEKHTPRRR